MRRTPLGWLLLCATMCGVANYLDFLVVLDETTRASSLGYIQQGFDMHTLVHRAGLAEPGQQAAAQWTGQLVHDGYVTHGPLSLGDRRALPAGPYWTEDDLQRVGDYRITAMGREEADRIRRQRRERRSDEALGMHLPSVAHTSMADVHHRAIAEPLRRLQAALDDGEHAAAIGASKDLVEAACKVAIDRTNETVPRGATLPALFKQAAATLPGAAERDSALGRSLAATVQRLGELRNAAGAGHGHASLHAASARHARLAASAASGLLSFLFDPNEETGPAREGLGV